MFDLGSTTWRSVPTEIWSGNHWQVRSDLGRLKSAGSGPCRNFAALTSNLSPFHTLRKVLQNLQRDMVPS